MYTNSQTSGHTISFCVIFSPVNIEDTEHVSLTSFHICSVTMSPTIYNAETMTIRKVGKDVFT